MPRVTRRASFVLLANAMLRAAGTLVFIAVGRIKGPDDAGVLALSLGYLAILTTLFLGLDDLLIKEVTAKPEGVVKTVLAYAVLRLPLTVLACLTVLALSQTASHITPSQALVMRLIVVSVIFDGFAGLGHAVLYAFGGFQQLLYAAAAILLLRAGAGTLLLVTSGFVAAAAMWPISALVGAVIVLWSAARIIRRAGIPLTPTRLEWPLIRHQAGQMPSFGAVSLLAALEYQLDIILLSAMRSPREVGLYAAASTVMNIVALIPQAYRTVLYPDLIRLRSAAPQKLHALIARAARNMAVLASLIAAGVTVTAPWLIAHIFGPRFYGSQQVVQVLIWNIVFLFVNVPLVRYLVASGQQNRVSSVLLISLSVNLGANLLLIPTLGAVGSAWARLASSAVFVAIVGVYVMRQLQRAQRVEPGETEVVK